MILDYIITYILIGLISLILIELINQYDVEGHDYIHITNIQRIILILQWPYLLFKILLKFIILLNEKN